MHDLNAAVAQLAWSPLMLILLGVGVLTHGLARTVAVSAAIGGSAVMGMVLISLAASA